MVRCGAYVLFVLLCAIPAWLLRDIVAAEGQLRVARHGKAIFNHARFRFLPYRPLGPSGQEHLWDAVEGADGSPQELRAAVILRSYDRPVCPSDLSEDECLRIMRSGIPDAGALAFWSLWRVRPEEAQRAASVWIRETTDAFAVRNLFPWTFAPNSGPLREPRDPAQQALFRVLSAGLENPKPMVRSECSRLLDMFRGDERPLPEGH